MRGGSALCTRNTATVRAGVEPNLLLGEVLRLLVAVQGVQRRRKMVSGSGGAAFPVGGWCAAPPKYAQFLQQNHPVYSPPPTVRMQSKLTQSPDIPPPDSSHRYTDAPWHHKLTPCHQMPCHRITEQCFARERERENYLGSTRTVCYGLHSV